MYSIADYGAMIADKVRMGAFVTALRAAVKSDSIVVDIGTGTGIFALLACHFGARRVYAIEPGDVIHVAREIAAANGYERRIEFIQALSTEVDLPEQADVIVSDIGGSLPWYRRHIPAIADARRRFLAPGGLLIPLQDTAWAAVIEAPDQYRRDLGVWTDNDFQITMEPARRLAVNTFSTIRPTSDRLMTDVQRWATVDYRIADDADVHGRVVWTARRGATAHGLAAGFDRTVSEGVVLSNAPDAANDIRPERIYGSLFFPWSTPVMLDAGDQIEVVLKGKLAAEDYVWSWQTTVRGEGSAAKVSFVQSTFLGAPLSAPRLRKRGASYTPVLNEDGRAARFVLDSMSQSLPVGTIARRLSAEFGGRFRNPRDTLSYVADLAQKYG
jgi:protein arginine N-methyltransferase 1